ncbi:MAG: class I SAM-dependent methyltransferase [Desulfobaccales bacterium]
MHFDAYTWYRHRLLRRFMIRGPIRVLNIGTGGGIETLRLLRYGNHVTATDNDEKAAIRTLNRVKRNGLASHYNMAVGHVLTVEIEGKFDEIYMCEVLEHIADDLSALQRISNWLVPGGRLILSTPTASYGQLNFQELSLKEDGGHLRVGYEGPELDKMLEAVGIFTLKRIYNGNHIIQQYLSIETWLLNRNNIIIKLLCGCLSVIMRPVLPLLDIYCNRPYDQITLAIKKYW